jgi:hypothetical protein
MADAVAPSREGLAEWLELSESLHRGIVHAFNNRYTALSAFAELAAMGDEEFTPQRILPAELARLQALTAHLRLLIGDGATAESMEAEPVLQDALALLAHHPRPRTMRCEVERGGAAPVRVPRWAFLRLLMVMVEASRRAAERDGRDHASLQVGSAGDGLVVSIDAPALSAYGESMAALCGGVVAAVGGRVAVSFASLAELRRRERAASAARDD